MISRNGTSRYDLAKDSFEAPSAKWVTPGARHLRQGGHALLVLIHERLGHLYDIQEVTFDVYDLGEPIHRKRMYVSGLLRCAVKRLETMSELTRRFRRRTVASPDMYFAPSEDLHPVSVHVRLP